MEFEVLVPLLGDRALLEHMAHTLHRIETRMATQADIDALTTALTADDAAIAQEIANLQAANPDLDLSALTAAVAATAALVPAATTPTAPVDAGADDGSAPAAS